MTTFPAPVCIWDLKSQLGEGPVWCDAEAALYCVDIPGRWLHRYIPGSDGRRSWSMPKRTSFALPVAGGGLICGQEDGLRRFDPVFGRFGDLRPVEPLLHDNRLNDGTVDAAGRLWFGTMHDPESQASGSLYRLDGLPAVPKPLRMDAGYTVANGPAIDPARGRLYHTDSAARSIYAFDLDADGGLAGKRLFAVLDQGYPDGMAVDEAGTLWVALWAGGGLQRFRPDGTPDGFVTLPCDLVTKIAFGDADRRTAYVTTARRGIAPGRLAETPLAGGLFRFRVDTPGLPSHAFVP